MRGMIPLQTNKISKGDTRWSFMHILVLGTILQVQLVMESCAFKCHPKPLSKATTALQMPRRVLHTC